MNTIENEKYLIFGAGVSGRGAYKLLSELEKKAQLFEGDGSQLLKKVSEFTSLILSPGISRENPLVGEFLSQGKEVVGEIEFSSRFIKTPIVAVTGSNGKTTVCTMLFEFLTSLGKKVFLGGNIGTPLSELAMKELRGERFDMAICEVSGFQLESITSFSPKVACILNLSFTHQERYSSFEAYIKAKAHIGDYQKEEDSFLLPESNILERYIGRSKSQKKIWKSSSYGFSFMKVMGEHNKKNFEHCFQIVEELGVSFSESKAQEFIENFEGVPLRVQFVGKRENVLFFNDSKSTNFKSTYVAIECFKNKKLILICGGKKRTSDMEDFSLLQGYPQIQDIYTTGESGKDIPCYGEGRYFEKLDELMADLKEKLAKKKKDTPYYVLFSPGFPSFDYYKNYIERGEHFNQLVLKG